jgi:predicted Zn-dependent protease
MTIQIVSRLTAAAFAIVLAAGVANAQRFGHPPPMGDNSRLMVQESNAKNANYFQQGVEALNAGNFEVAEGIFEEVLRASPTNPQANLMMGSTKMSINKWEEAKKYLEIAVRKDPKSPDPKSRLGVTLIKLGDIPGAMEQRAALEKMDKACKGKCRNAEWIASGIAMIDGAMPPKQP